MLTKRAVEVLGLMEREEKAGHHEDAEIVCEGFVSWLGYEQISYRTVKNLIEHCCISLVSAPGDSPRRFTINGTGKAAILDPEVAEKVKLAATIGKSVNHLGEEIDEFGRPK